MRLQPDTKTVTAFAGLACVVTWIFALSMPRDFSVGNFVDDAHYAVLAKALREGAAYRAIHIPDQPQETKYPPGYPTLLAAVWSPDRTDAQNLERLRWVNLILVGPLAAALVVLATTRLGLTPHIAVVLTVGGLLNPLTSSLWVIPLSEPLFLILVTTGLTLSQTKRTTAIVLLLAAVYVRTIAVAFLIGIISVGSAQRNKNQLLKEIGLVVAGLTPWFVWQALTTGSTPDVLLGLYGSYSRWFLDALATDPKSVLFLSPLRNFVDVLVQLGHILIRAQWTTTAVSFWFGGLVVVGLLAARRKHPGLFVGLTVYACVAIAWPYAPGRFVGGVVPLIILALGAALNRRVAVLAVVVVALSIVSVARNDAVFFHRIRHRISENAVELASRHVQTGTTLSTTNPPLHFLRLGVKTVPMQRLRSYLQYDAERSSASWGDGRDLWALIQRYQPSLVLTEGRGLEGPFAVADLLARCPGVLTPKDSSDGASLYTVSSDAICTEAQRSE